MKKIISIIVVFLLTACTAQHRQSNELATQLNYQSPQQVLSKLQNIEPPERDLAQYQLNLGLLQFLSADFTSAIESLSKAKKQMLALSAISISENAIAGTVNETLRSYSGYPTDRVMVHNMLALSYLFNHDIDAARVEMLQADIEMKKLVVKDSLSGQLASAHLLTAIIYEFLNEQSNALISYRKTEEILMARNIRIPLGLKESLLRMSYEVDPKGLYSIYTKRYSPLTVSHENNKTQVYSLFFDGVVSHKEQASILVPSFNGEQLIRISMPTYYDYSKPVAHATLFDATQQFTTELIENLETLVREDLDKDYPSILLYTTTRAVAKYQLVEKSGQQDPLLGSLINIATILTEVADLRSWNMLPSNIQFAYMETTDEELLVETANIKQANISLKKNAKNLLLISHLQTPIFHYSQ
ncbi:COG3014 family protein [Psychromonas sp. KJ10-10]|uniref:COG3014 family protein n=1 Tax=Psychromonas sp. KJ10-10 TaxID=3391823 RepID=UPI0039B45A27